MDYKNAGVDIEAGYKSVELMKKTYSADNETGSADKYRRIFRSFFYGEIQRYGKTNSCIRN